MRYLKTYDIFESDSWAGSLYAYDKSIVPVQSDVMVPRKTFALNCNDCGISFDSFTIEDICKNCGSENTGPVNINPV